MFSSGKTTCAYTALLAATKSADIIISILVATFAAFSRGRPSLLIVVVKIYIACYLKRMVILC